MLQDTMKTFFHESLNAVLQEDMEKLEAREREQKEQEAQKKLFDGLKFFLNREVPRESLAFIIRWVKPAAVKPFTTRNTQILLNLKNWLI